ncbi:hypothetical protein GNY06_02970 [Elizabethkingia argentiflava]|uniref:HTH cro/C1-type domain-containing protein n=2 Tax=Elizabethkingia argenteiflava TaxID=2681556 RepID=A0A845PRV3_9FLAO|nr:hypothetical protein [Elizabethkingia argenteiflava]
MSRKEFSDKLAISIHTLDAWENGKRNVPTSKVLLIHELFGKSTLVDAKNNSIRSESSIIKEPERQFKYEVYPVPYDDYMMVEYADITTAAGRLGGENLASLPETKRRLVPKEYEKGNYLVITVQGDSMDDGSSISIPNGSEILVREYIRNFGEKLPIRNNLFVIVTNSGTVFKQIIEENDEDKYLLCHSYNPKYKDYKIPFEEIIQIFIFRKIVSFRPYIPEF